MPDGLLLLAFALTLVVNAVLIAVAIRAMRPGGAFHEAGPATLDGREQLETRRAVSRSIPADDAVAAQPLVEPLPRPVEAARVGSGAPVGPGRAARRATATASPAAASPAAASRDHEAATEESVAAPTRRRRATGQPAAATPADQPPREPKAPKRPKAPGANGGNGRRRRFSLPPLDADSEKVSRSIETFLSGGEAVVDGEATSHREPDQRPPTAAAVSVKAPDRSSAGPDGHAATFAVEHALRGAARRRDHIEPVGDRRLRVVVDNRDRGDEPRAVPD